MLDQGNLETGFQRTIFGVCILGLALAFGAVGESVAAEFKLIAGTQVAVDTPFDKGINYFKKVVEEKSNGRVEIINYPGSQLGNEPELFQGLMEGTVDIAVVSPGQIAEWVPQIALLEMPFVITSPRATGQGGRRRADGNVFRYHEEKNRGRDRRRLRRRCAKYVLQGAGHQLGRHQGTSLPRSA